MKIFLKRFAAAACALVCVLALTGAWVGVRLCADAGTYGLTDIEGDRAYMDGISVSMRLADAAHTQHMTLENGALSHSYEYVAPFETPSGISFYPSQAFVEDENAAVKTETSTTLESSDETYELWVTRLTHTADSARISASLDRYDHGHGTVDQWAQVVTDVTVRGENYPFEFNLERETTVYKNQKSAQGESLPDTTSETPFSYTESAVGPVSDLGYSVASLYAETPDGTVYFTPSLMPYYGGTSAIYRIDEWGSHAYYSEPTTMADGYACYPDYNARALGSVTKLVEFPVDGRELRTVALDVAGGRLCLLLVVDGTLTLRTYSMEGVLEYEVPLFEMSPELQYDSVLFSRESGGATTLCYSLKDPAYNSYSNAPKNDAILFCVQLAEKAELMSVITGRNDVMHAAFIGGHWVLAETEDIEDLSNNYYMPQRHYISVLDTEGSTLYRGEVVTDAPQDMLQYYIVTGTERPSEYTVSRWLYFDEISEG